MYFVKWATEVSDLHGLKHAFGPGSRLRQGIWSVVCLTSLGLFIWQTSVIIIHYREKHHITKTDLSYVAHLDFPSVTVCNVNKYRESAFTAYDIRNVGFYLGMYRYL